jgi:hypothetical protein
MLRSSRVARDVAGVFMLFVMALLYAPPVRAESGTGEIAECIEESWDEYIECIDDLPWWAEVLCAARFTADVVLCLPKIILDGAKN